MRNNIAFLRKLSSCSEVKFRAKFNAKINSALILSIDFTYTHYEIEAMLISNIFEMGQNFRKIKQSQNYGKNQCRIYFWIQFCPKYKFTTASFLKRSNIISHLFAS